MIVQKNHQGKFHGRERWNANFMLRVDEMPEHLHNVWWNVAEISW